MCSTFCPSISCRFKTGTGASNHHEGKKQLRPIILRQGASPPINNREDPYQPMGALSLHSFKSPRQNRAPLIDVSVSYKVGPPPNQQSTIGRLQNLKIHDSCWLFVLGPFILVILIRGQFSVMPWHGNEVGLCNNQPLTGHWF